MARNVPMKLEAHMYLNLKSKTYTYRGFRLLLSLPRLQFSSHRGEFAAIMFGKDEVLPRANGPIVSSSTVPSEKCVVCCVVVVVYSELLKIFSVELTYRHNSVFVVLAEGNFVCHSDKCREKRAVHMASVVSFACDHTKYWSNHIAILLQQKPSQKRI